MDEVIPRNSGKPRQPRRILLGLLSGIGRALLVCAFLGLAIAVVFFYVWWQVVAIPYRRMRPETRSAARKEAVIAVLTAAAAAAAAFRAGHPAEAQR